ncbi:hypothetical protein ACIQU5_32080 [Streptomyces sp. NPDC090306]|uniref:hypothetical protein n=1 Tax=Streptomyces sp. NPDC090306 TaxID=3365961 RepID=UPI00380316E2
MSFDLGAVAAAGSAALVGFLTYAQSRRTERRSDFGTITERLDRELEYERAQRRLLTRYVLQLRRWAQAVPSPPTPVPEPPPELDYVD